VLIQDAHAIRRLAQLKINSRTVTIPAAKVLMKSVLLANKLDADANFQPSRFVLSLSYSAGFVEVAYSNLRKESRLRLSAKG
jgi:hypothetical protein